MAWEINNLSYRFPRLPGFLLAPKACHARLTGMMNEEQAQLVTRFDSAEPVELVEPVEPAQNHSHQLDTIWVIWGSKRVSILDLNMVSAERH
jgi:hypothetical protein